MSGSEPYYSPEVSRMENGKALRESAMARHVGHHPRYRDSDQFSSLPVIACLTAAVQPALELSSYIVCREAICALADMLPKVVLSPYHRFGHRGWNPACRYLCILRGRAYQSVRRARYRRLVSGTGNTPRHASRKRWAVGRLACKPWSSGQAPWAAFTARA
jgi:hypothetical protein